MISSFLVPIHGPGLIHSNLNKSYSRPTSNLTNPNPASPDVARDHHAPWAPTNPRTHTRLTATRPTDTHTHGSTRVPEFHHERPRSTDPPAGTPTWPFILQRSQPPTLVAHEVRRHAHQQQVQDNLHGCKYRSKRAEEHAGLPIKFQASVVHLRHTQSNFADAGSKVVSGGRAGCAANATN